MANSYLAGIGGVPPDLLVQADLDKYYRSALSNAGTARQAQQAQQDYSNQDTYRYAAQNIAVHPSPHQRAYTLFLARLGGIKGPYSVKHEDYIWTHVEESKNLVHVFFLLGGQSGHVTENMNLFPSDTLVTQFRILIT